jgi:hypothetical protein
MITELEHKQEEMHNLINEHANKSGLSFNGLKPILDGVHDVSKYLESPTKVMWIMKEAYDDSDEKGNRGGWSIFDILDENKPIPQSWYNIIYVTYGIFKKWETIDMYKISEDPPMKDVMSQIAYINLNKMPANKTSSDDLLEESYKHWKPILMAQIELYKPQVIIFGNTFKFFKDDLLEGEDIKPQLDNVGKNTQLYIKNGIKLVDAYHPAATGVKSYADSIISFFL